MNFIDKVTGRDMTREFKGYEARIKRLPEDYQTAWQEILTEFWKYTDFTGRNLLPYMSNVVDFLEEMTADNVPAETALGDVKDFVSALTDGTKAMDYREKWRQQLNANIYKKLGVK